MTAVAALITLAPPAVDEAMIMAIATWATEPIRPASLLQSSLTLLLAAYELKNHAQFRTLRENFRDGEMSKFKESDFK